MADKKDTDKTNTVTIYDAILDVQQKAPFIDKSTANPFFKSKYADLPTIWGAVKDLMGENKLLVMHTTSAEENGEFMTTTIIHAPTKEKIESKCKINLSKHTAQEYGSYMTYMRRYSLSAMLGLVTDEDDDGNAASHKNPEKVEMPQKEFTMIRDRVRECLVGSFEGEKENIRKAWPRMSKEQQDAIKLEIDKKASFFAQVP